MSVISDAAAALGAGEWAEISSNLSRPVHLQNPYGADDILVYAESMMCDPTSGKLYFLNQPHTGALPDDAAGYNFIEYVFSTNTWSVQKPATSSDPTPPSSPQGLLMNHPDSLSLTTHSFETNAYDQAIGRWFHFIGGSISQTAYFDIRAGATEWVMLPDGNFGSSVGPAICWFPEFDNDNGGLIYTVFEGGPNVYRYLPRTNTHAFLYNFTQTPAGGQGYHQFAEYNPTSQCMITGGGNGFAGWIRIDPDETITEFTAPSPIVLGITTTHICAETVTGKFLVYNNNNVLYELDAFTGVFTEVTGVTFPTGFYPWAASDAIHSFVHTPIVSLGVSVYITEGAQMFIYKHGAFSPPGNKIAMVIK